jgi:hypothetical protein
VSVFEGHTADCQTVLPQVKRIQADFGIAHLVVVGDRGMISHKAIEEFQCVPGVAWLTAMKSAQIRSLVDEGGLQMGLFDEGNLFEFTHPDYPGEGLVACRNGQLAQLRAAKRADLLRATVAELDKVCARVARKKLTGADTIGVRVGRVVNKYKVAKHFELTIEKASFSYRINQLKVEQEAALDGIYVLRTPLRPELIDTADIVRSYQSLSDVERAFRSWKTVDLKVRPIHHHLPERVRAHILLCMLAYYLEWHMREAWRSLLFADEDQAAKATRDPVAPATRSQQAEHKARTHTLSDGTPAHSFRTLLDELSTIVRNTCRTTTDSAHAPTFTIVTQPNATQERALQLLDMIAV